MTVTTLEPRRHAPPPGWPVEVFERVTDALAAALVGAVRRQVSSDLPPEQNSERRETPGH